MFQLYDEKRNKRYPLTGLIKEIGRTSECDLCIPEDEQISRLHARLEWNGGAWVVVDQGSTNGTFVNGERVTERVLQPGDVIEIGDSELRYLPLPIGTVAANKKTTEVTKSQTGSAPRKRPDPTRPFAAGKTERKEREK